MGEDVRKRERCELHGANGIEAWCTRENCIFWRLIDPQDEDVPGATGCGLQFFNMIEELKPEMARWLLAMKKKLEGTSPEVEKARITFRRRERQ